VDVGVNVADKEKRESVPWTLLITLLAVLLTFFIVMPVMGYMYLDMYNATNAAVVEVKKMKALDVAVEAGVTMDQATEAEEEEVAEVPIEADFMIKSQRVSKRLVVSDLYN
jgi:flagellar biosynthesis protein FliP